ALGLNEVFASSLEAFRQMPGLAAALDSLPDPGASTSAQQAVEETTAPSADRLSDQESGDDLLPAAERIEALDLRAITVGWEATPMIDGLDLHAERGGWTLLCGDSGTGKSTSLSVLLRFLDPWAGSYTARGTQDTIVDMLTRAPADLVGRIAWCPQEAHIFRSTVRGNLALSQQ